MVITLTISCKKDDEVNTVPSDVEFGIVFRTPSSVGGRTATNLDPDRIQVTVKDNAGNIILDSEIIDLIPFGSSFVSDPVRLVPGSYRITSFLVLNDEGTAIFATPLEGSELVQLVTDPLPIEFQVTANRVNNVQVEVISTDDNDPSIFGYASFIPVFIPTFQFEIVVFEADTTTANLQTTTANLMVTSGNNTIRDLSLTAGVNLITVRDGLSDYTITVNKGNFPSFSQTYTISELQTFSPGNPLEVILIPDSNSQITSGRLEDSGQVITTSGSGLALGDIDGDGDIDAIITARSFSENNAIWINDGNGQFSNSGQSIENGRSSDVELADLDGDGDLDAFITNLDANFGSTVWFNNGSGSFSNSGQKLGTAKGWSVSLGDLDGDLDLDAFVTNQLAPDLVWFNNGNGFFSASTSIANAPTSNDANTIDGTIADIDSDNNLDLISTGANSASQIFLNDNQGGFVASTVLSNSIFLVVKAEDFDRDGDIDIVLLSGSNTNEIHFNNGSGTFQSQVFLSNGSFNNGDIGDLDGDGDLDIIGTGPNGRSIVFMNDGEGDFQESQYLLLNLTTNDVEIADLNGDGILDAFIVSDINSFVFFGQP